MSLFDTLPTFMVGALFCLAAVALTSLAQIALHRRWPLKAREELNQLTGFVIAVVGVIYAVLLASIAILAIERFDRGEAIVETEAGLVGDLFRDAAGLPEPYRGDVRAILADYAETVIAAEWTGMENAAPARRGWQEQGWSDLERLLAALAAFEPQTNGEEAFLEAMLALTNDLFDARRDRILLAESGIGAVVWWVVFAGAIATVGLALVFGIENRPGHLLISNTLSVSIALVLVLIVAFDRPFSGRSQIDAEPFLYTQDRMTDAGR